jgi:hypothetical protein
MRYKPVDPQTAQALTDAAAQCLRSMRVAGLEVADDLSLETVAALEELISSYLEGHIPNEESVFQFVALLGETVRRVHGGHWAEADVGRGRELGVVTDGPYADVFWNITGKMRKRLQLGVQESLTFYWKAISEQLKRE